MKTLLATLLIITTSLVIAQTEPSFAKFRQFSTETVDLSTGEYLVGVFNTNCDHCQETAIALGKLENNNMPKLYALFYNEIPEVGPEEFSTKTGTNYPYIVIGDNDFWTLLKASPPIIYYIKDNKVLEYFEGDEIAGRIDKKF